MSPSARSSQQYEIILRGECKRLLTGLLDESRVETGHGFTCVTASVRDEAEFYGLLERFQDFGLHVVSLNELDDDAPRPRSAVGGVP
jgi:hypothetical protein